MIRLERIVRNVLTNYVVVVVQLSVAFIMTPFLIGSLGDERYGLWSIIAAFTGYLTLLDMGIVSAVTKFMSQHQAEKNGEEVDTLIGSAAAMVLPISLLLVALSPVLGNLVIAVVNVDPTLHDVLRTAILLSTLEIAVFVFAGVFRGIVFGSQRHDISNALVLSSLIAKAGAFYLLLSSGFGLVAMSAIALGSGVLLAVGYGWAARHAAPDVGLSLSKARRSAVKRIGGFSTSTFVSMIAGQLIYYSDAFVIGYALSATAVAYYTVAWSLAEYVNRLMVVASRVFVPVFSIASASSDRSAVYLVYEKAMRYQLAVSNLFCIGMLVMGDTFISIWIGPDYAEVCGPLILILFASQLFRGPQLLSYSLLQGLGLHKTHSYVNLGFSFVNLALSLTFVHRFGLVGVATATALTQVVFYGAVAPRLALRAVRRPSGAFLRRTYLPAAVPGVLLCAVLYVFDTYCTARGYAALIAQACAGAALYGVAVVVVVLDREEVDRLTRYAARKLRKPAGTSS